MIHLFIDFVDKCYTRTKPKWFFNNPITPSSDRINREIRLERERFCIYNDWYQTIDIGNDMLKR